MRVSEMRSLYNAYAAVHNEEIKEQLESVRDEITEMDFSLLSSNDVEEIVESSIEKLFHSGHSIDETETILERVISDVSSSEGRVERRAEKIERLVEAIGTATAKVREKAIRNAVESYTTYRKIKEGKDIKARLASQEIQNISAFTGKQIEEQRQTAIAAFQKLVDRAAEKVAEDAKYGYDKKGKSLNPADIEARKRKSDDLFGSPKKKASVKESTVAKKEIKDLQKAAETLKGKNVKKADELEEKDSYKTVAAVIDYDRSKKGSKDADWDSLHGKKKAAKKERDYAAWERSKMKKDDPDWKHKKYHTGMHGESVEADKYIETVQKVKKAENEADKERWAVKEALEASGKFSSEEIERILTGVDSLGKPELQEKDLNAAERRALPDSDFALPGKGKGPQGKQAGSYPIPDEKHARSALSLVAQHGTAAEKATVRAKVKKKFPGIEQGK